MGKITSKEMLEKYAASIKKQVFDLASFHKRQVRTTKIENLLRTEKDDKTL